MSTLAPYLKALVGALIAGLASLQQALDGDNSVTAQEWTGVVIALLSGLALVWAVPNKDPHAMHQAESVQPPERGAADVVMVAVVVLLVLILLAVVGVLRV